MDESLIEKEAELAGRIQTARNARSLNDAVEKFVALLIRVPDYPVTAFPSESVQALRQEAEGVIERIEQWVSTTDDDERRLVEAVYDIRRALEEIERWRQHYLRSTKGTSTAR